MAGPSTIFTLRTIGPELRRIIAAHDKAIRLATFTAATRGVAEVVKAIDETPLVLRRKRGSRFSRGKSMPRPIDTGTLRSSARVNRLRDGAEITMGAPYAGFVEFGTKPHAPPPGPIKAWAARKVRGTPVAPPRPSKRKPARRRRASKSPRRQASSVKPTGRGRRARSRSKSKARAAALLASRTIIGITKHGTEPRNYFGRASQKFPGILDEEVRKRLARIT